MNGLDRALATPLLVALVLSCGACRQTWTFARHDEPIVANSSTATPSAVAAGQSATRDAYRLPGEPFQPIPGIPAIAGGTSPGPGGPPPSLNPTVARVPGGPGTTVGGPAGQQTGVPPVAAASYRGPGDPGPPPQSPLVGTSFATAAGEWPGMPGEGIPSGAPLQPPGGPIFNPLSQATAEPPAACEPDCRLAGMWQEMKRDAWSDCAHYYSWTTFRDLGLAVAIAAPIANTSVDQHFRDWYQRDARSRDSNHLADFWRPFGNGYIVIPSFAGLALLGRYFEDVPVLGPTGDFSSQVMRGYLVGAPPMLFLQYALGSARPGVSDAGSHWRPFHADHGVSGHAFMGAVPFITAANMVENPWAKGTLYVLSTFTGWSRIDNDAHYLSQVFLGWWMGYLACRAVDATQQDNQPLTLTPIATPEMVGVGMVYRR